MTTSFLVVPWGLLPTFSIFRTTSIPSMTEPKTTCLPSSHCVFSVQRKNWLPLVAGPALAMERIPGPLWEEQKQEGDKIVNEWKCIEGARASGVVVRVFQSKVFVFKFFSVDGFSSGSIVICKVPSLAHEFGDDAMESGALVSKAVLHGAQGSEIFRGFRDNVSS
jgi:hypothetical protein